MRGDLITNRRSARAYARVALRKKTFTERINGVGRITLSTKTQFVYNTQTGVCNPSCALWVGGREIYPTKQRLRQTMPTITGILVADPTRMPDGVSVTISKKRGDTTLFPVGSEVVVSPCEYPAMAVVGIVHVSNDSRYVPLALHISKEFCKGVLVDITLAKKGGGPVIEYMGRHTEGTAKFAHLQYAKLYDANNIYIGTLSAQAETWSTWDPLWTGNIEMCFQPVGREELVLLGVVSADVAPTTMKQNIWKAKSYIRQWYVAANTMVKKNKVTLHDYNCSVTGGCDGSNTLD